MRDGIVSRWLAGALVFAMGACTSGPQVSVTEGFSDAPDAPYRNILVITLFSSFDARRYLEEEIVKQLAEQGTKATRSTSMMNTKTPVTTETFIKMVDDIDADAVLVTQLTSHDVQHSERDASPQTTVNYWPTYYFNVYAVQVTEYVEPPRLEMEHDLVLRSEIISVQSKKPVWAIDSRSEFVEVQEDGLDYAIFVNEAKAIVRQLSRDKLIAR